MRIKINTNEPYDVVVERGIIDKAGSLIKGLVKDGAKVLIVSETNVFPLYGEKIRLSLESEGYKTYKFIFEAGEPSKKIQTVYSIYQALAENGFTRTDFILTLGGGVAGDMGGFAAATYLRGIKYIQIPTSLLAQVDASIGGKTGVDLDFGKNLVGAFHQPKAVLVDPDTLKTLPDYYFNDGLGEVIKYGCIQDAELFNELETAKTLDNLEEIIAKCIYCKKVVVEEDTKESGRRMILNFGHTFGHALEKLHNFTGLAHGEAVGIGMVIAAGVGENLGVTEKGTKDEILAVLKKYNLPTSTDFSNEEIINATALDKKSDGDKINIILLKKIGEAVIYKTDRDTVLKAM